MSDDRPRKLRRFADDIPIAQYLHYRDFLKQLYADAKKNLRPYSYIKFSEDLGFGANNSLRLIIIGQRPLTVKAGKKIAGVLDFTGNAAKYWAALVQFNNAKSPGEREAQLQTLLAIKGRLMPSSQEESRLKYFAEWYHAVIRELALRSDFQMDPRWIQSQLVFPLRLDEIKRSMELLTKLGLVHYSVKLNRYVSSGEQIDTGPDARGIAFIGYQQRMIELGKESITRVAKRERELASATLSLPKSKLDHLKGRIRELVQEAVGLEESETEEDTQVVQFNVQMFPHTR